ncbi:hypothetical protein F2Q70_00011670 [Brassica cretica]|uniref:Uncharacterized protein n=2 Tax=Brassica cretica TaxID=69181 RepID=A0A8S9JAE5_BRACR|nr:hypothetical protein F2Q68_00004728 [Brassica cretica]KAF2610746.1 hypothetical protein F2Q70_00011670 [Brassica cretica]KAF3546600.1 hypothetical protein DY000_02007072 [Brassica cretica]
MVQPLGTTSGFNPRVHQATSGFKVVTSEIQMRTFGFQTINLRVLGGNLRVLSSNLRIHSLITRTTSKSGTRVQGPLEFMSLATYLREV